MSHLNKYLVLALFLHICACSGSSSNTSATNTSPTSPVTKFANLSTIGNVDVGHNVYVAAISNTNVFYTDTLLGLCSVDISNPLNLKISHTLIDSFQSVLNLNGYDALYNLVINGNTAVLSVNPACLGYCNGDFREIRLYDISIQGRATYLSTILIPADHIILDGNFMYITSSSNTYTDSNSLNIVDISKPAEPVLISTTTISGSGYLAKNGNIIYISQILYDTVDINKFKKIQTINVSNTSAPILETVSPSNSFNQSYSPIIINNNILYYLDRYGLNVVNINDRLNPVFVKSISLSSSSAYSFTIYNNKLYIAAGSSGVMIYDISQPDNPKYLKSMKSNTDALSVKVSNGVGVYITDVLKQTNDNGYSIVKGYMLNLFFDK